MRKSRMISKGSKYVEKENIAGYVLISPFIIGFLCFNLLPILASIVLSFTKYDILSPPSFNGIDNYIQIFFKDPLYWKSFGVTIFFTFISVPLKLVLALVLAMLFVKATKMSYVYRSVFYLPSIIGGSVAIAILWKNIFSEKGVLNSLLQYVGVESNISWLGRTDTAIWTLILLAVWQFGSPMLIFLADLKQIPASLYEAAMVDGANPVKRFFKITLPMLTPVIFFNLVIQMIYGFISFTQCYIITQGKPLESTLFYTVYMYRRAFKFYQMGYGSAMAWIMLMVIAILTALIFKTSDKWVYYENSKR